MPISDQKATPPIRDSWLRLGLALTPPAAIAAAMVLALLVLRLFQRPLYLHEMLAAALVSVVVGILAVLPMVVLIGRGAILLLRCAVLANMTRLVGVALGAVLVIAFAPVQLHKTVLVLWLVAFYFVLLVAESMVSSWVIKNSKV